MLRDELLTTVAQVGGRLGELRFDTDLDVSHAVVRYLELLKLAALIERTRAGEQSVADALPEVNARLLQAATAEQREIFETSALDEYLLDAERDEKLRAARGRRSARSRRWSRSCPRRGDGLVLSASDIETYRTCPLKYKFARVFRIPSGADDQPALRDPRPPGARALPRARGGDAAGCRSCSNLLEAGWRRGGFGDSEEERQLRGKATAALVRYHDRFRDEDAEPVWFERSFQFRIGPHLLRGRVDRVDRLPDGGYELIDYKTGRPKTAAQLREDVQLSLYAVGARESWQLEAAQQAYYYVLDDEKVPVERSEEDRDWITDTVHRGRRGDPRPGLRADAVATRRARCATTASPAPRPSAERCRAATSPAGARAPRRRAARRARTEGRRRRQARPCPSPRGRRARSRARR